MGPSYINLPPNLRFKSGGVHTLCMEQAFGCIGLNSNIWLVLVFLDLSTSDTACQIKSAVVVQIKRGQPLFCMASSFSILCDADSRVVLRRDPAQPSEYPHKEQQSGTAQFQSATPASNMLFELSAEVGNTKGKYNGWDHYSAQAKANSQ